MPYLFQESLQDVSLKSSTGFQFQGDPFRLRVLISHYGTGIFWIIFFGLSCRRFLSVGLTRLYITLNGHPARPDVQLICFFKRSLGHSASRSPKANTGLIKMALSVTVVLTLQLAWSAWEVGWGGGGG